MADLIVIPGIVGSLIPVGKSHIEEGEYLRVPGGKLFHFVSYLPETVIVPVKSVPEGGVIVDLQYSPWWSG